MLTPIVDPTFGPGLIDARRSTALLGIKSRKFWELSNAGAFPTVRIGRRVLFDPADLRAYADKCKGGRR